MESEGRVIAFLKKSLLEQHVSALVTPHSSEEDELTQEYSLELVEEARAARERAYAPYSNFRVGAALLTASGQVFRGGNVENASYGGCICAERSAGVAAVAAGEMNWLELAVVADTERPTTPCGICRQFLAEFAPNMKVVIANRERVFFTCTVAELLPHAFDVQIMESQKE